ncbi:MAG: phosphoenolpyruvate carboxylase [Tessaracoccus sp.]|uniref:phosphoenolpyruvate carboxylase n=1 Tax=Tessaracoccus sp. TaxID=1971211 RepID=UPI001EC8807D|nr:phosphoenolpyruvate carboxylase [Tessaracoccus sp.]MBK7819552.1 phosphoenolpyruvate carboxylase [Tessaracoccus sp.]
MSEIDPTPTDATTSEANSLSDELRADVRLLTTLLGQVLSESGSQGLFEDVEALRQATIAAHHDDSPEAFARAIEIAESFTVERADEVARAFTVYFHLVNLAEEYQRVRFVREGGAEIDGSGDTIPRAFAQLATEIGEDAAQRRLENLRFHPVFTAHPTEARRRAVASSIRRLAALLEERAVVAADPAAGRRLHRRLLEEIDTLWRTAPLRATQPAPEDEVRSLMAIFDATLYTALPRMYRYVDDALQPDDAGRRPPLVKPFVRLGTWVGGDRDGNPFVTPSVTIKAAAIASEHVLLGLEHTATTLARSITLDSTATPPSSALTALRRSLSLADEATAAASTLSAPNEPHKQTLVLIARRIAATRTRNADLAYANPGELIKHLRVVQDSLSAAGALRQAFGTLQTLIWQVETFGFHLADLEVRQHSAVHAKALAECETVRGPKSQKTAEVLDVFHAIAQTQRKYGQRAAGRYIVSFTQSADDLAAVYKLAKYSQADVVLDVIPLFETFADLRAATGILAEAVRHPEFAARLKETGGKIEVMLGYSDSSKDVGPLAANLALYDAQVQITDWARANGYELTLFHGRGGALGRGGGPTNTAILAQPPHSVDGRFKLTEQGEVVFARYGDPTIAMRHIDQVAAATLLAAAPSIERRNVEAAEKYADVAARLTTASRSRFDSLVKAEGFAPWFATVTPMEEIGRLQLGSRPARRGLSVESLEDLRAIPWVFAWSQARINLAGWFGLGSALETIGDIDLLRTAYEEWPLFRTVIDNVGMSLAKADPRIARRYLDLGDRPDLTELVLEEMELTRSWLIRIVGGVELLDNRPELHTAVHLRSPYVDVLSMLQLRALRVLRSDSPDGAGSDWEHLLLLSVSGVSAGLQNTG